MKNFFPIFLIFLCICISKGLLAQNLDQNYFDYIETYHELAIRLMWKYKIPASITLAQGLLESGAGQSIFSRETNNHFGTKCHFEWEGEKAYHTDDQSDECFRKYCSIEESFEDHAAFLLKNRYVSLFFLDIKDYIGWAFGLQKCGYATDESYAKKLIKLIEDYRLNLFDDEKE